VDDAGALHLRVPGVAHGWRVALVAADAGEHGARGAVGHAGAADALTARAERVAVGVGGARLAAEEAGRVDADVAIGGADVVGADVVIVTVGVRMTAARDDRVNASLDRIAEVLGADVAVVGARDRRRDARPRLAVRVARAGVAAAGVRTVADRNARAALVH